MSGFFAAAGAMPAEVLARVVDAARHRGSARIWQDEDVALVAFARRGEPAVAVADDLVVAGDMRIDNGRELDAMLGAQADDAHRFLAAWRRWGTGAIERVLGDYAVAVWDRGARSLVVARDPMAGRPALIAFTPERAIAGSSLSMLLADPLVDGEIDPAWAESYLRGAPRFAVATGYRAIERLRPGWVARADGARWDATPAFEWRVRDVRERDERAYAEALRELLAEAVRCRIASASAPGVSLSGGLDSTSVAAFARRVRPEGRIVALGVPFEQPRADERALQAAVAERLALELRWAPLEDRTPFGDAPHETLDALGVPPIAPNMFFVECVADAASAAGVDLALDGIDGDAVFAGNWNYLADLLATGRVRSALREARAAASVHRVSLRDVVRAYALEPLRPRSGRTWRPARAFASAEREVLDPGTAPAVLEQIDEVWARRGVTVAHPMLDRRVVEFALGLPRERKVARGITKIVLRDAVRDLLPAAVVERTAKAELGGAFFAGLSTHGMTHLQKGLALEASNLSPWNRAEDVARLARDSRDGIGGVDAFRVAYLAHWRQWCEERGRDGGAGEAPSRGGAAWIGTP